MNSEPLHQLDTRGWTVIPRGVTGDNIPKLVYELESALIRRDKIRKSNNIAGESDGTLHHLLTDHNVFIETLEQLARFENLVRRFLSGNFILNSYGGVVNHRTLRAYVHNVHRDIRFASDAKKFMLNCLIM